MPCIIHMYAVSGADQTFPCIRNPLIYTSLDYLFIIQTSYKCNRIVFLKWNEFRENVSNVNNVYRYNVGIYTTYVLMVNNEIMGEIRKFIICISDEMEN